jgi:hypothetical protein
VQAIEALAMSLMIGLVFYNLGTGQIGIRDRFGLLYIIGALYPYMVILDVVGQCKWAIIIGTKVKVVVGNSKWAIIILRKM